MGWKNLGSTEIQQVFNNARDGHSQQRGARKRQRPVADVEVGVDGLGGGEEHTVWTSHVREEIRVALCSWAPASPPSDTLPSPPSQSNDLDPNHQLHRGHTRKAFPPSFGSVGTHVVADLSRRSEYWRIRSNMMPRRSNSTRMGIYLGGAKFHVFLEIFQIPRMYPLTHSTLAPNASSTAPLSS